MNYKHFSEPLLVEHRDRIELIQISSQTVNEMHSNFVNALPYPHIVLDGAIGEQLLEDLYVEFPDLETMNLERGGKSVHMKGHISSLEKMSDKTKKVIEYLNSANFLSWLETLTGINGLIPDPYLSGGGFIKQEMGAI